MTETHRAADPLDAEILAYEAVKKELEAEYEGQWVVFTGGKLWRVFDTFQDAAVAAEQEFGKKALLIQQVGEEEEFRLPSSLLSMEPYVP